MKNLKSLFLGTLVASTLMLAPAKKAEAGVIVGFTGAVVCAVDSSSSGGCTGVALGLGAGIAVPGVWLMIHTSNIWVGVGGGILLVLDQENPTVGHLEEAFTTTYPFIDNEQVIKNLAAKVSSKIPTDLSDKINISLTENETREALEGVDLTEEQVEFVVNNLK